MSVCQIGNTKDVMKKSAKILKTFYLQNIMTTFIKYLVTYSRLQNDMLIKKNIHLTIAGQTNFNRVFTNLKSIVQFCRFCSHEDM